MSPEFDVAIVGGGVVGLAVLERMAAAGLEAILLERHPAWGREVSSRNSEVVHGGMYYAPGSLKARLCVEGRRMLYRFCEQHDVPHRRCGKVIVAVNADEEQALTRIEATGKKNGVEDLRFLSQAELATIAPGVEAAAALHSPHTGVVNAHALMDALAHAAQEQGATLVLDAAVEALERRDDGWEVCFHNAGEQVSLTCRHCVNAAGLEAQNIMRMAGLSPEEADLRLYPCKGRYFSVQGASRKRINSLIYPAPEANLAGLGIHTVVDTGGGVKLGPDVEYVEAAAEYDYSVDETARSAFFASAGRYLPFLALEDIHPDMAGIRPKLAGPGQPARDFYIADEAPRGLPGFINLAGIESPGLTACLAIAEYVKRIVSGGEKSGG